MTPDLLKGRLGTMIILPGAVSGAVPGVVHGAGQFAYSPVAFIAKRKSRMLTLPLQNKNLTETGQRRKLAGYLFRDTRSLVQSGVVGHRLAE